MNLIERLRAMSPDLIGNDAADAIERLDAENAALKAFAHGILKDWPDCSCDGFDIQELGQKTGVLVGTEVTESCGEGCNCAEYDGFPLNCYRVAEFIKGEET